MAYIRKGEAEERYVQLVEQFIARARKAGKQYISISSIRAEFKLPNERYLLLGLSRVLRRMHREGQLQSFSNTTWKIKIVEGNAKR